MIRVAAVADIHAGPESVGVLAPLFASLKEEADLLLLAGDLTRGGDPAEAEILVNELKEVGAPIVAVLGNHDFEAGQPAAVIALLKAAGIHLLDRGSVVLDIAGQQLAIAGTKGFGGGFDAALADDAGEPEMKAWIHHAEEEAEALERVLSGLVGDIRIVLLHYAPVTGTLSGERLELYPFLGNSMLGAAIDRTGADLVVHGHAHRGSAVGITAGGIPVRNVARPVIRQPYAIFVIESDEDEPRPRRGWRRRQEARGEPAGAGRERSREGRGSRWMRRAARKANQQPTAAESDNDR